MSDRLGAGGEGLRSAGARSPLWKKVLLSVVVTGFFFFALEVLLAVVGIEPERYADDPYVGFSSLSPLFIPQEQADGSVRMVTAENKRRLFNDQAFAEHKDDGVTRVFCMGGSTTYGRPYDDATSFCGWLRELLPAADPSRTWQVINAGGISYASYRVATLMEELADYEPDLFIIYSGHNEFLERRTYSQIISMPPALRGMGALASRTRTHAVMRRIMARASLTPQTPVDDAANLLDEEVTTLLDNAVGPDAYSRDDLLRERVLEHYRFNLARMVDIARATGAATLMVTPASNLRNCAPFKSENLAGLDATTQQRWKTHMALTRRAIEAREVAGALKQIEDAISLDDRYAWSHYLKGQILDVMGDAEQAKNAYERARDEDVCPLRALGAMRDLVIEVAANRRIPVADFVAAVEQVSTGGAAGKEIFLDHVHPTVGGNRLLALAIMGTMGKAGMLKFDETWGQTRVDEITRRVEGSLDQTDHGLALMKLSKVMGWAGKASEARTLALRAVDLLPEDSRVQYQAGLTADLLGKTDEAIVHYRKAVLIQPTADLPHLNLGVALEKKGQLGEAIEHYRLAVAYGSGSGLQSGRQNLAMALGRLGARELASRRPGEAVDALAEAVELAPDDARLHNFLAISLWESGQQEEARERFGVAVRIDPELAERSESLAEHLRRTGRAAEARDLGLDGDDS